MSSSVCYKLCCICVYQGMGSWVVRGGVWPTAWKIGQLACSVGIEWKEVCILAPKATIPRKDFFNIEGQNIYFLFIVQFCMNTVYFSFLQVKNKPREGVMNLRFSLDLLGWLRTVLTSCMQNGPFPWSKQKLFVLCKKVGTTQRKVSNRYYLPF